MSDERLLKRGMLAEAADEMKAIEARTRAHVQTMRNVFDNALNLPHMDLEMAMEAVKDLSGLKARYKELWEKTEELKKELGL